MVHAWRSLTESTRQLQRFSSRLAESDASHTPIQPHIADVDALLAITRLKRIREAPQTSDGRQQCTFQTVMRIVYHFP